MVRPRRSSMSGSVKLFRLDFDFCQKLHQHQGMYNRYPSRLSSAEVASLFNLATMHSGNTGEYVRPGLAAIFLKTIIMNHLFDDGPSV